MKQNSTAFFLIFCLSLFSPILCGRRELHDRNSFELEDEGNFKFHVNAENNGLHLNYHIGHEETVLFFDRIESSCYPFYSIGSLPFKFSNSKEGNISTVEITDDTFSLKLYYSTYQYRKRNMLINPQSVKFDIFINSTNLIDKDNCTISLYTRFRFKERNRELPFNQSARVENKRLNIGSNTVFDWLSFVDTDKGQANIINKKVPPFDCWTFNVSSPSWILWDPIIGSDSLTYISSSFSISTYQLHNYFLLFIFNYLLYFL